MHKKRHFEKKGEAKKGGLASAAARKKKHGKNWSSVMRNLAPERNSVTGRFDKKAVK